MNRRSVVARRFASLALAAVSAGVLGCQGAQQAADQPAQEKLAQAQQALIHGQFDAAESAGSAAASTPGISPQLSYQVHTLQGRVQMARARQLLTQAQDADLNVSRLLGAMSLSTGGVLSASSQIQADEGFEPTKAQEELKQKISEARGGQDKLTWGSGGANSLPTLFAIDQEISRLQAALADNKKQADSATQSRTQTLETADQSQQKSLAEPGKQAVEDVKTAALARQQAATIQIQLDKLAFERAPLEADLRTAQAQRKEVDKLIAAYTGQISDLDLTWQAVKQSIEEQRKAISAVAAPGAAAPSPAAPAGDQSGNLSVVPVAALTISDQATQLKGAVAQARDLRDKAATMLKSAITDFQVAGTAGDGFRRDVVGDRMQSERMTQVEKNSWLQLQEVYSGGAARLAAAESERELAINYAADALIAIQVKQALTAVAAALGAEAPPAIADCLAATASPSVDDYLQLAEERFKNTISEDAQYSETVPGPAANLRKASFLAGKMITAYAARQLSLALNSKPVAGQTPKDIQATIDSIAKDLNDQDPTLLPAVPYTLPAPDTQPAASAS